MKALILFTENTSRYAFKNLNLLSVTSKRWLLLFLSYLALLARHSDSRFQRAFDDQLEDLRSEDDDYLDEFPDGAGELDEWLG